MARGHLRGLAAVMFLLGVLYSPVAWGVALPFAIAAYILWYQASGRLRERARRREPGDRRTTGRRANQGAARSRWSQTRDAGSRRTGRDWRSTTERNRPNDAEAHRILGVDRDASQSEIRRAYRDRVKQVHPDRDDGDEAAFKQVTAAYDRLKSE
ncbi:J domain-containing protein [Halobacteriaceae archaeon GCM10025711]